MTTRVRSLLLCSLLAAGGILSSSAQTYLDTVAFGNAGSEAAHAFVGPTSFLSTNTAVSPAQVARRVSAATTNDVYGGALTVTMNVDPVWRNYVTLKLWGSDDVSDEMGRLYLYVSGTNFVGGPTNNYQIGYRHEGDYAPLSVAHYFPPLPGRFFYSTTLLPLWMTQGRTNLTLQIMASGRYYAFGSGGPPSGNQQFAMLENSRSIYAAYTHTQPSFDPSGEVQGSKPTTATRPSPTVSVLSPGGSFHTGVTNYLNGKLKAAISTANFGPSDIRWLAHSYYVTNLFTYTNPAVVTQVVAMVDCYATNYFADTNDLTTEWGGKYGWIGRGIAELQPQLTGFLDVVTNYGVGGTISRRSAWGQMLKASRDFGRFNRRGLSNQGLLNDEALYLANQGLLAISNADAFSETNAQRYLKEAIGLAPWLGSDLVGGGSDLAYGTNYYQVTEKGQSREFGYVGCNYGEMQPYAAAFYRYTGNPIFRDQAVKMVKARVPFRRPSMEVSGSSYYRTMEGIGLLAWRGASESDGEYASQVAYGVRGADCAGMLMAGATQNSDLIGYAKQMLTDNQYFTTLNSYWFLDVFQDYATVTNAADNGARLPMTDGQPDFAWADEDNGIVAAKHGNERLWLSAYWEAGWGTGINGIGRFLYARTNYECYGVLETTPQINFSGTFFVRPNMVDLPYKTGYQPPDNPINAYAGERLPLSADNSGVAVSADIYSAGPFRGKARFWFSRYANFLIGINRDYTKSFELKTPAGFTSAMDLISGQMKSGTVMVAPRSTVVLYLNSATDSSPLPKTPPCLTAVANSAKVMLEWNPSGGSLGYNVKRAQTSGGPYTTITNVTDTNYMDTSVTAGGVYFYVVTGTNTFGESAYNSMEASATIQSGISVNFQGGSTQNGTPSFMVATESAGQVSLTNWNNAGTAASGTVNSLKQSDGTATTASVAWSCNNLWSTPITDSAGDYRMMKGYLDTSQSSTTTVTVTNLPAAYTNNGYSVYVYFDGDNGSGNKTGMYSIGATTNWPSDGPNANFSGTFTRAENSTGNYLRFDNLTGSGFTLQATGWPLNGSGVRAPINAIQVVVNPLATPGGLVALAGNAQVTLNWNAVGSATSYNVKRSTTNGGPYIALVPSVTTPSFMDTNVTNGVTYYYVVSAVNPVRESTNSTQVSATPTAMAPVAPTGLMVTGSGPQVSLVWNAASNATNYNVKWSTTSSSGFVTVTNLSGTNATIGGANSNVTYYFVVSAVNAVSESANSTQVATLAAPVGLAATPGNAQATLTWLPVGGATAYEVKRSTTSGSGYVRVTSTFGTSVVDTGLNNGATYYYIVSALNSSSESSDSAQIKVIPMTVSGAGFAISVNFVGGGNGGTPTSMGKLEQAGVLTMTNWNNATIKSGTVSSLGQSDGATTTASVTWSGNNTWNTTISDVAGDYRMMKGYLDLLPNGNPTNATVTVTNLPAGYTNNGYSVFVYFDGDGGSDKTGIYTIGTTTNYATDQGGVNFSGAYIQANNSVGNYMVFTNLTAKGFTLIANGNPSDGNGGRAPINGIQVVANTPALPSNLTATAGNAQVSLNWNAVGGATSYNLKRWLASASSYVTVTNVTGTNVVDAGLANGTTYYYVVSAVNTGGESQNSTVASATPLQPVPAAPATVAATLGDAQVVLAWSAVSSATGYNVKSSLTNGGAYSIVGTNVAGLAFTNAGLINGTIYYYVVSALNVSGESTNSLQASARPVSLASPQLQMSLGGGQLQFNWPTDHIGWRLVSQTNSINVGLTTNWMTVGNSAATNQMTIPIGTTDSSVFFRLVYP